MIVRHFPANAAGRDFVVGDLHGHLALFRQLLREAGFDPATDRMFSVGDLIDRGPDSPGCLALLDTPWFFAVQGNHEDLMANALAGESSSFACWQGNGGDWAAAHPEIAGTYVEKVKALPLVIAVGEGPRRFNVLHAETFMTDAELDAGRYSFSNIQRLLWGRSLIQGSGSEHGLQVTAAGTAQPGLSATYVGHSVVLEVKRIGSHVFIDTGAFLPMGRLTMIEPASGRVWTASHFEALAA
ncbi:metallophosphoesterase [Solimonas marina]|uniref:metallophosphoesterase n=1 Tax=Solimonas marina TaxID=2714601 RepID=UPI0019CF99DE